MKPVEIITREYDAQTDDPYIYSTWIKYSWYSPKEPITMHKKDWWVHKSAEIKALLKPQNVRVACFKDNTYTIAGYMVATPDNIHHLCVKKDYRNQGVEELLLKAMKGRIDGSDEDGTDRRDPATKGQEPSQSI
jgi:hypothetical protein